METSEDATNVDEIVAVKAPTNNAEPQLSTAWGNAFNQEQLFSLNFSEFQETAKSGSGPCSPL
jgi:hypothetical protein